MNNNELAESLTSHIQNMLDLSLELNSLVEKENEMHGELNRLGKRKAQLQKDIKDAKKLLDWCLETRSDPTQARLTNTDEELRSKMEKVGARQTLLEDKSYYDVLTQMGITKRTFTG